MSDETEPETTDESVETSSDAVVEVPGQDTTVVVRQGDGTAAAVAVSASEESAAAAETAAVAAEAATQAEGKADESLTIAERTLQELQQSRAETAEMRTFVGELYRERQEQREADRIAAEEKAAVKEVPVNDAAAREQDNGAGGKSEQTEATASSEGGSASASESSKPKPRANGLRRRANR